jgi:L-ribulose-5-phosphate 4-epimerase
MLEQLKAQVYKANLELVKRGVVIYTWGNVSGIDREKGLVVIKPSGVDYDVMKPEDMVVVKLDTGEKIEGKWNPSSDTKTHLELYRAFPEIGGISHTHSVNAVAYAQAGIDIPALGTTHADYYYGNIPCTRELSKEEVYESYETNTGRVIIECIRNRGIDPMAVPGIVVKNHGPFCWGRDADASVYHAVVMEVIAEMNIKTLQLNPQANMESYVLDKHYMRKHGPDAYYGQENNKK